MHAIIKSIALAYPHLPLWGPLSRRERGSGTSPVVGNRELRGARRHAGFDHVVAGAGAGGRHEVVPVERGGLFVEHVEYLELEIELVLRPAGLVIHAQVDIVDPWRALGSVRRNARTRRDGYAAAPVVLAAGVQAHLVWSVGAAAHPRRARGDPHVGAHDPVRIDRISAVDLERM